MAATVSAESIAASKGHTRLGRKRDAAEGNVKGRPNQGRLRGRQDQDDVHRIAHRKEGSSDMK